MLYTKDGSYPGPLPHRIRLSDGTTRTGSSTFTDEEIADAGYTVAEDMPTASATERVQWTVEGWVVTDISAQLEAQARNAFRNRCLDALDATDYKVIKALEAGLQPDADYAIYRQALRDAYNASLDLAVDLPEFPTLTITVEEPAEEI